MWNSFQGQNKMPEGTVWLSVSEHLFLIGFVGLSLIAILLTALLCIIQHEICIDCQNFCSRIWQKGTGSKVAYRTVCIEDEDLEAFLDGPYQWNVKEMTSIID